MVGIDLDPRVASLFHSEFHLGSLAAMPFEDESVDVIFCEYVIEHVDEPHAVLGEMTRVLKPGGRILILTPNLFSYKVMAAAFTPHWFHLWMGRIRYGEGQEADMYPTLYRCNTAGSLEATARRVGLEVAGTELVTNGPTWFEKLPLLFELAHIYHLAIARWRVLCQLRCALIIELRKAAHTLSHGNLRV